MCFKKTKQKTPQKTKPHTSDCNFCSKKPLFPIFIFQDFVTVRFCKEKKPLVLSFLIFRNYCSFCSKTYFLISSELSTVCFCSKKCYSLFFIFFRTFYSRFFQSKPPHSLFFAELPIASFCTKKEAALFLGLVFLLLLQKFLL